MLTIVPIQPHQIPAAKEVILAVARRIYAPEQTLEAFTQEVDQEHILEDLDHLQDYYDGVHGLFLVVLEAGKVIGTGAVRPWQGEIAELKRLWLLEDYHGQGIGYRVVQQLFAFARQAGYKSIRLQTGEKQQRAIAFYKKLGFVEIPNYNDPDEEVSMEIKL